MPLTTVLLAPFVSQVMDMRTYKTIADEQIPLTKAESICGVAWCPDGQILTVSTTAGDVFNFLAHLPAVHASCGSRIAYLSSLREVSIVDALRTGDKPLMVSVNMEPMIVALGPSHVAVAMNNRVIFYRSTAKDTSQVDEHVSTKIATTGSGLCGVRSISVLRASFPKRNHPYIWHQKRTRMFGITAVAMVLLVV